MLHVLPRHDPGGPSTAFSIRSLSSIPPAPASPISRRTIADYLGILGLLVALVLLIACVNVANMMTAQAAARAQEMALRISIGAGRRRLVQLILCQSALLALLASVLGAFFAAWSAPFVLSLVNPPDNPARLALPADWRVLLFGFGLIILVVLLLGLLPALRASAVRPVAALKGGEDPHSPRRLMRGAIALQVAFCFLVLFLSSLFVASFQRLQNRPLGFSTDRLLLLETVAGKGQLPVVWNQTAEALRAVPGVDSVAISGWPLLGRIRINSDISINGAPPSPTPACFLNVSPGWLSTMKIPLVSGRDFRPEDTSPGAAIVNETFVKTFFPGQDPIGRTFATRRQSTPQQDRRRHPRRPLPRPARAQPRRLLRPLRRNRRQIRPQGRRASPPSPFTPTPRTRSPSPTRSASSSRSATTAFASRTSPRSSIWSATRPFASA